MNPLVLSSQTLLSGRTWCAISLSLALSACSLTPPLPATGVLPAAYADSEDASLPANVPADLAAPLLTAQHNWRQFFQEPRLVALLEQALLQNHDLRLATQNVEKVRAAYQISDASRWPALGLGASQNRQRLPAHVSGSGTATIQQQTSVSVGVTAWELDLFGKARAQSEQALALWQASRAEQQAAQVSLLASVANSWYSYAQHQQLLKLAEHTAANRAQSEQLTAEKVAQGVASSLTLAQMQSQTATAKADVARYQRLLQRDLHALQLLAGGNTKLPDSWLPDDNTRFELPVLAAGAPSDLLLQRPDLRAAEQALQAANANIGVARAGYFPSISLTATGGTLSDELSGLFDSGSGSWSLAPRLDLPLFNWGRTQATVAQASASQQMALIQYQQSIAQAFREVSDQLIDVSSYRQELQAQQQLNTASFAAKQLSQQRFDAGADSYLQLLDAERSWYTARQQQASTALALVQAQIGLYKALGGGWQSED